MRPMQLAGGVLLAGAMLLAGAGIYFVYLEPRPTDTTEARVYTEEASRIDYCDLPLLDGSGLKASEIPKAYTPSCATDRWPAPVLQGCTEPLPPGAADLRGLWRADAGLVGHVERIEQCGDRVVVSGRSFIHDFRTTGSLADGANDINPRNCHRVRAAIRWSEDGVLEFRPWGLLTLVSRRLQDEDTLIWTYPGQPTSTLKRLCRLPAAAPRISSRNDSGA